MTTTTTTIIATAYNLELVEDAEGFVGVRFAGERGCGSSLSCALNEGEIYSEDDGFEHPIGQRQWKQIEAWFDQYEGL